MSRQLPNVWRRFTRFAGGMAMILAASCGADYGDPGPSYGAFEYSIRTNVTMTHVLIMIVDDRTLVASAKLRADLPAMVRDMATLVLEPKEPSWRERARWTPLSLRVVLVPASSKSMDGVVHPGIDPGLRTETERLSVTEVDALASAVQRQVERMEIVDGTPFRPLERARDVAALVNGERSPATAGEEALVASATPTRPWHNAGVAVIAATDDESDAPVEAYRSGREDFSTNVITPHLTTWGELDPSRVPRLAAWEKNGIRYRCDDNRLYQLFWSYCGHYTPRCETPAIAEISPGIGACYVEVTTDYPLTCDPSRGWADPRSADGIRRPRLDAEGKRVCEILPVETRHLHACVNDPVCAECGSGWCLSHLAFPTQNVCANPLPARRMRWIGGALAEPGTIRIVCREPA
jgi:hypothetical protein